ncbi:MAG TPA: chemotaxis protein CheB, partial [Ktedonobacteraceae bacterium]|nr:chemotaxis protein CheB [Ktedonobacteraceae bacterium]
GIGASAGGLEAFIQLLINLPPTLGMAYVFIQHMDPTHESLLPDILSRVTTMPVSEVRDRQVVELDHVYVIIPNTNLTISKGRFVLLPRELESGQHLSIDTFLRSLAADRQQLAIGVLLSGTAYDGTHGLAAIKQAGGITFAQDVLTAKYTMMPQNAISAGCVDVVLPPDAIAKELAARSLALHAQVSQNIAPDIRAIHAQEEQALTEILLLLRRTTGVDFLLYKRPTIQRRLLSRMALHKSEQFTDYLLFLQNNSAEVEALFQQVLITVTSFFRDPAAFDALKHTVFPALIQDRAPEEPIRVWVMGCSTGEEVYSLAISLIEFLDEVAPSIPFLLFATDINEMILQRARVGIYSPKVAAKVSSQRLSRFFTPVEGGYQVCKTIRERCVFALHNVTRNPPFSRLDLVSCRNVLIYLRPALQQKILQTLHYALKSQGFLMLGISETAGVDTPLFSRIDAKNKLYIKKNSHVRFPFDMPAGKGKTDTKADEKEDKPMHEEGDSRENNVQREADQMLLAHYVPASVVIDADMEILQFRGHTSPYLEPASGKASFNLLRMARNELGLGLRSAISAAKKSGHAVTREGLQIPFADSVHDVTIEVIPLKAKSSEQLYLIVFTDTFPRTLGRNELTTEQQSFAETGRRGNKDRRVAALERELATTKVEMQTILEEREAANEELQAANEEILSSNEELQSINEELETTQEEIQATNEELTTLNQELSIRNEQLNAARDYADAIIETVREPLIVLNADLCVMRANTSFYQTFHMTAKETEQKYLYNLQNGQWKNEQLRTFLEDILPQNHSFKDFELDATFPFIGHRTMLLNARRIIYEQEREHLILLAFEDITERKELEAQKDAFLGMVSHELKTPVTSTKAYAQLLQRRFSQNGDEPTTNSLGKMNTQLDRLTMLINDLLDVTSIETGKLQIHPSSFAIDDLVREIVEEMQRTTKTHHILIKETAQRQVYSDQERIGQVLTNLLSNAIKYAPRTEKILVRATASEDAGGVVTVSVQDFGTGIPQEKQEQIFKRFFRVESPTQKNIGGLGLGLYISSEIIKQLKGHLSVESTPGKGSTFFFTIPCTTSEQE